jgi:hypothetical protein
MTHVVPSETDQYWSLGTLQAKVGVNVYQLLKWVAIGQVRVMVRPGFNPKYNVEDVTQCYRKDVVHVGTRVVPVNAAPAPSTPAASRSKRS